MRGLRAGVYTNGPWGRLRGMSSAMGQMTDVKDRDELFLEG